MNTEKMREEFETAFVANLVERHGDGFRVDALELLKEKAPSGEYENYTPFIAWWAWQASRAAIEVELPSPHQGSFGWMHQDFAVQRAIEASGLKWTQGPKRTLSDIIGSMSQKVKP